MSTKANLYLDQALAATGFAVIDSTIACTLRPDLWSSGMEAAGDFSPTFFRPTDRIGVRRYRGYLEGREDRPVEILARSHDRLAMRVEWITGMKLVDLYEVLPQRSPGAVGAGVVPPRNDRHARSEDVHAGVATKEAGRACGECDHLSVAGRCMRASVSTVEWPNQNAPRRCVVFQPKFDANDQRTGLQLWPELREVTSA